MNFEFLDIFSKNSQVLNFMKIHPVGGGVVTDVRTGRETDITKLIVAFRDFVKEPKPRVKKFVSIRH